LLRLSLGLRWSKSASSALRPSGSSISDAFVGSAAAAPKAVLRRPKSAGNVLKSSASGVSDASGRASSGGPQQQRLRHVGSKGIALPAMSSAASVNRPAVAAAARASANARAHLSAASAASAASTASTAAGSGVG